MIFTFNEHLVFFFFDLFAVPRLFCITFRSILPNFSLMFSRNRSYVPVRSRVFFFVGECARAGVPGVSKFSSVCESSLTFADTFRLVAAGHTTHEGQNDGEFCHIKICQVDRMKFSIVWLYSVQFPHDREKES